MQVTLTTVPSIRDTKQNMDPQKMVPRVNSYIPPQIGRWGLITLERFA